MMGAAASPSSNSPKFRPVASRADPSPLRRTKPTSNTSPATFPGSQLERPGQHGRNGRARTEPGGPGKEWQVRYSLVRRQGGAPNGEDSLLLPACRLDRALECETGSGAIE